MLGGNNMSEEQVKRVPVEEMDPSKVSVKINMKEEGEEVGVQSNEEAAAQVLQMYTPVFNNLVSKLSGNSAKRVLNKLVEFPLNDKEYKATSVEEAQAFMLGDRLNAAKFILIMHTYNDNIEEIKAGAEAAQQSEEKKEE